MPRVTALGCSLTGLTGAFVAVAPDMPFEATIAALALFAVAGEQAAKAAAGPGSFAPLFLDELAALTPAALDAEARVVSA
jgi:hydroxyethylthiazole kinase